MHFLKKNYAAYVLALALAVAAAQWIVRLAPAAVDAVAVKSGYQTLIIDAGHGGEDGGAVSCSGLTESRFNLEISLRLCDLCALMGIPVKMVRTTDTAIYSQGSSTLSEKKISDLHNRVALVEETPGALLVSIHQNTFSDGKYRGAQVFYAATPHSSELAEEVQQLLNTYADPRNNRKCKPAKAVYLMKSISCTAILVECGFLSNPEEEQKLRTPEYQKKLVAAVFAGINREFTKEYEENEA